MRAVVNSKTKEFLFLCADKDYQPSEEQIFIDSIPPNDLVTIEKDEYGNETAVFKDIKWNENKWQKM